MVSNGSPQQVTPAVRLASLLMQQRGEIPSQRTLRAYSEALKERVQQLRTEENATGAELFRTIPRQDEAAWEAIPQEEQALYDAVVRDA